MTQAFYAHMNNKRKTKKFPSLFHNYKCKRINFYFTLVILLNHKMMAGRHGCPHGLH
jgi:hypothetical protein